MDSRLGTSGMTMCGGLREGQQSKLGNYNSQPRLATARVAGKCHCRNDKKGEIATALCASQ